MDSGENMSHGEQEVLKGEVLDSLGEPHAEGHEISESHESDGQANSNADMDANKALASAKKRLKAQSLQHQREVRELHARMNDIQSKLSSNQPQHMNPSDSSYNGQVAPGSIDEHIHKAVSFALQHKDAEERKAKEAEGQAKVAKAYRDFQGHLDQMGDKYDDFHDKVFSDDARFTPAMRDYAMTLPRNGAGSAGEVLYALAKNPSDLERIRELHPLEQAAAMATLSHALIKGGEAKNVPPKQLGNIKTNPAVNSSALVTDKTPVSEIRARMKAGTFKSNRG